ncbi:LysM peptidoglycan-binding domain-containing protein [Kribbella sp. NPDC026596]|uniref:LysM peptidoglycan-binding domain-containing protein n=1 Tax=Kribbella sp. NPDC026596 TaxID=3155122 RepID=UPI0033CC43D7
MSTTALSANALVGRHAPEAAPSPSGTPRRRPRIAGTTTEPLPVRACSGDVLGRSDSGRVRRLAVAEAEAPALRLTRRGRMLLTALSVIVFGSAIVVLGLRMAGVLEPGPDFSRTVPVQVAPGQTLWSIAQDTNPAQDPGTVVEKIADLNKLSSPADIVPGQTLQIPIAR